MSLWLLVYAKDLCKDILTAQYFYTSLQYIMVTARSGRLFSGGDNPTELVLFESERDNLDRGVPTALITKLVSQCNPSSITHVYGTGEWTEFDCSVFDVSRSVILDKKQVDNRQLWSLINTSSLASEGIHLVVLDTLKYLIDCFHLYGLVRALHDAQGRNRKVIFTTFIYPNDFDSATALTLRSIAMTIVEVEQVAGQGTRILNNQGKFQVWDDLSIRVLRGKSSGRVNVDIVSSKFDSKTNTLIDYSVEDVSKKQFKEMESKGEQASFQQDLPFRVALSSNERRARAAVALPYAHRNANIADSGLELHPKVLQVANYVDSNQDDATSSESEDLLLDEEGDDLFSEDV